MSASDWTALTQASKSVTELYAVPPRLNSCDLFYLHIDERDSSVTLGFSTKHPPTNPPPEWGDKGHNTFEFYLSFSGVEALRVTGWGPPEVKNVELTARNDQMIAVSVSSPGSNLTFQARSITLTRSRSYVAASE